LCEATPEAAVRLLAEQTRGLIWVTQDLRGLVIGRMTLTGYRADFQTLWTRAWRVTHAYSTRIGFDLDAIRLGFDWLEHK
jgi:hypothetical protein